MKDVLSPVASSAGMKLSPTKGRLPTASRKSKTASTLKKEKRIGVVPVPRENAHVIVQESVETHPFKTQFNTAFFDAAPPILPQRQRGVHAPHALLPVMGEGDGRSAEIDREFPQPRSP